MRLHWAPDHYFVSFLACTVCPTIWYQVPTSITTLRMFSRSPMYACTSGVSLYRSMTAVAACAA